MYADGVTFETGPAKWVNWWMSYLNYQIEHHLFPSMPQFRMPQVSPRVRALFEKHGVEYKSMGYTEAMKVTFANLDKVGKDTWYVALMTHPLCFWR